MRTILLAFAALAAASVFNVGAARAQQYPYCLVNGPGPGDCKYDSYEQCMATASGTGKYCQPNYWLPQNNGAMGYGYGRSPRANRYYGPQY
ncbi:hypothetical protein V1291_004825 [Nitrobacteraceae bacterium AZCC 1564]